MSSSSVRVNILVCFVPEGSAVLVCHRRGRILSESAPGGEDGSLGQVFMYRPIRSTQRHLKNYQYY